jgi:hypothetical protein
MVRIDRHVGAHKDTSSSGAISSLVSYPYDIISGQYFANDTILKIQGHPDHCEILKSIRFDPDSSLCPNLWDVVMLTRFVHDNSPVYTLQEHQCYWFADTIFGVIETFPNGKVVSYERGEVKWKRRQASIGSCGIWPVHRRIPGQISEIWSNFMTEQRNLTQQVRISI